MKCLLFGLLLLFIFFLLPSCKKFLDVRPSSTAVNPSTIGDFEEMLNNDSLGLCNFFLADVMSDDILIDYSTITGRAANYFSRSYLWDNTSVWNPGDADFMYNGAYSRILQMNIILDKVDAAPVDSVYTQRQKNIVRAQAEINRAWYYLQLVNIYGEDYQSSTAATALGVPLVLLPDANAYPARATVKQVYDRVLSDLRSAVASPDLPDTTQDIIHPGKAAGYALLARAYLYMGNYDSASDYADSVLAVKSTLLNYGNGYQKPSSLIDLNNNPEILLGRLCIDSSFYADYQTSIACSNALLDTLTYSDPRYYLNFSYSSAQYYLTNGEMQVFDYSVGVPEVMLTKAECLARKGNAAGAIALVNELRQNRLPYYSYTPLPAPRDALPAVLAERRRELFYHGGLRLFDLKRLNRDQKYAQTIRRTESDGTVAATLPPGDNRYLMQFAPLIISTNPNIIQNPR